MKGKSESKRPLYVSTTVISKYNVTAAYVFAQVAYHIVRHGVYDTAHGATASYTRIAKSTVIKYLKQFVEDGLLAKVDGKDFYRSALVFNLNNDVGQQLKTQYTAQFNKKKGDERSPARLVMVDVNDLDKAIMQNMKATRSRALLVYKNLLVDKFASNEANGKGSEVNLGRWSQIAKLFGCAINTAKSIIDELKDSELLRFSVKRTQVGISYLAKLAKAVTKKVSVFKGFIDGTKKAAASKSQELERRKKRPSLTDFSPAQLLKFGSQ